MDSYLTVTDFAKTLAKPTLTPNPHAIYPRVLCYVVYGDDPMYYQGAKVSVLSFLGQITESAPLVVILSEKPFYFQAFIQQTRFNFIHLTLNQATVQLWSNDDYHYRIKTLGLAYITTILMRYHYIDATSRLLFFDSDTYFLQNPLPLYDKIGAHQVLMYKKEPVLRHHKKYRNYVQGLQGQRISYRANEETYTYVLDSSHAMHSSLIMGITPAMLTQLLQVAALMYPMRKLTCARTVEQFAFYEVMQAHYDIALGVAFVAHYSRRRQKAYVEAQLDKLWQAYPDGNIDEQIVAISQIAFDRPWHLRLLQFAKRFIKPESIV